MSFEDRFALEPATGVVPEEDHGIGAGGQPLAVGTESESIGAERFARQDRSSFSLVGLLPIPSPHVTVAHGRRTGHDVRLMRGKGDGLNFAEMIPQRVELLGPRQIDVLPQVYDAVESAGDK